VSQNIVAIICDCDGTLCPDTSDAVVRKLGLDSSRFWKQAESLVESSWDPPLAYLTQLLREAARTGRPLTKRMLEDVGQQVVFYPGATDFVQRLASRLNGSGDYRQAEVTLEWYIVSSGIEELLRATPAVAKAKDIFGCSFEYDAQGTATGVKRVVTFTEKTKFVFAINKGISGEELRKKPYRVNDAMASADRRVPFEHMVYLGDGPSDIPCFSMIKALKGHAIGVTAPGDAEFRKPYELAQGYRLTVGPYTADYRDDTDLMKMLWRIVESIANSIVEKRAQRMRPSPHP